MYRVTRLKNDLTVATAEMPHMTGVSVGIWVGAGSRYEPAELNGVSHFIEHLLFKGTRKRSARDLSEAVEGVGGYLNAFTSEEATCFHARAGHERFDEVLDVLADMLINSKFAPSDVAKEREVIKEEMAMYLDEPQHHVQELLNATLWPDHPLGRSITGTEASLDAMGREHLVAFLRDCYVTGATVVVCAGRISHRNALRGVNRYARHFTPGKRRPFAPARSSQQRPRIRLFTKKTEQTQLALGIRTCSRHDERRYPLRLLNTILGENMSSRLFQIVREDRGLAYSIYSTPSLFEDTGDLVISAGCDTGNVEKTLKLVTRELRRLTESPPGRAELNRARDYVLGQIELGQESTENQMNWIGEQLLGYGKVVAPSGIKRQLATVTAAQVRAIARDFFRPDRI
ncbi:MAG TPA: pitrilysin family protein, partial [Verrucomicrobiae bacterium]